MNIETICKIHIILLNQRAVSKWLFPLESVVIFYANFSIINDAFILVLLPIFGIFILIVLDVVFLNVKVLLFNTFVLNVPTLIFPPIPDEYILPLIIVSFINTANCVSCSV